MEVTTHKKRYIAYYRVSTDKQGKTKLGLEAQEVDVNRLVGSEGVVLKCYIEVETGKITDRPELKKALAHAKMSNATLIVAKLDRLARNLLFIATMMESGVDFICCDCPYANRLTLHLYAAIAEDEGRKISDRTKKALAVLKERGKKLGSARDGHWAGREHLRGFAKATVKAAIVNREAAEKKYGFLIPKLKEFRNAGKTLDQIADWLFENGHVAIGGKKFTKGAISRILSNYGHVSCAANGG
jgi:DNA invertase Pin-like site-specific DNA recombinase